MAGKPKSHHEATKNTKKSEETNVCKKLQLADVPTKAKLTGEHHEKPPLVYPQLVSKGFLFFFVFFVASW